MTAAFEDTITAAKCNSRVGEGLWFPAKSMRE